MGRKFGPGGWNRTSVPLIPSQVDYHFPTPGAPLVRASRNSVVEWVGTSESALDENVSFYIGGALFGVKSFLPDGEPFVAQDLDCFIVGAVVP